MRKYLGITVGLILLTFFLVNFINGTQHTAQFNACPDTDYCSEFGLTIHGEQVQLTYSGWPFKVKLGNPDWCPQSICEENNFHPDYRREFFVYNAVILSIPTAVMLAAYAYRLNRRIAKRFAAYFLAVAASFALGWFTMFMVRSTVIWRTAHPEYGYNVRSGIPYPSTLSIAAGCNEVACARPFFRHDTSFWHSELPVYVNWVFWSGIWLGIGLLIQKNYAHTRN